MSKPSYTRSRNESGTILVLSVFVMFVLLALAVGIIDVIYLAGDRRQAQWVADAAARAAVKQIGKGGTAAAKKAALTVIGRNQRPAGGTFVGNEIALELGEWDISKGFQVTQNHPNSIQVTVQRSIPPLLGQIIGFKPYDYQVAAVATVPAKDIVFVLDVSGSMEFDTRYSDERYHTLPGQGRDLVQSPSGYYYLTYGQFRHPSLGVFYSDCRWYYLPDAPVTYLGQGYMCSYWWWYWYWLWYQDYWTILSPLEPIHSMKVGAVEFARKLDLQRVDRAGVVAFDDVAELRQGLTNDFGTVRQKIMELVPYGGTDIGLGIRTAVGHLNAASTPSRFRQKIIVLSSDGCSSRPDAVRAAESAKNSNIIIFTISIGQWTDRGLMQAVAQTARGREYYAHTADELSAVFKEVFEHLPSVLTD